MFYDSLPRYGLIRRSGRFALRLVRPYVDPRWMPGTAERMNLFGHFETMLHLRFPDKELVVRNFARPADEVASIGGHAIAPAGVAVENRAFDVTPARLVTGFITERGVCAASRDGLLSLYPERRNR